MAEENTTQEGQGTQEQAPQGQAAQSQNAQSETQGSAQSTQAASSGEAAQTQATGGQGGQQTALSRQAALPLLAMSNPFLLMRQMSEEMDRLFSDALLGGYGRNRSLMPRAVGGVTNLSQQLWAPQLEVFERDNQLVVRADLPGMSKEDVQVQVQEGALVIQGERKQQHEEQRGGLYRSERSYGSFQRVIPLPEGANPDEVKGSFKDGVLELTVPMPQQQQQGTRQIELQ